ncbi:putative CS domain containing protein [Lyophyllum shimeji]|uniref:CS domain containing protein n=1 Tax=Lyophyllum shimeji TaxID=47721 RepID=A0A9P3PI36_LYOSH|nr:putative CS domain containing protein [Lyophyllum shimeji]
MTQHPEILWAQRSSATDEKKNVVYLTVNLPDIQETTLSYDLTPTSLSFKAKTGNPAKGIPERDYAFNLDFYEEIVPEESTSKLTNRAFILTLRKKEKKSEYWPRLTKEKARNTFIKTDFSKWVDEDEQEGAPAFDEDFDLGTMSAGGMPGGMPPGMDFEKMMADMGRAGGAEPSGVAEEEEESSEDEGPPPLEEVEPGK